LPLPAECKSAGILAVPFLGSWAGVALVMTGGLLGRAVAIVGLVLALVGWKPMSYFWMLLLLWFHLAFLAALATASRPTHPAGTDPNSQSRRGQIAENRHPSGA
jgi:hypothetical protein